MVFRGVVAASSLVVFLACATALAPIPDSWTSLPHAAVISEERLRRAVADTSPRVPGAGSVAHDVRITTETQRTQRLYRGDVPLTPEYQEIGSFDVSMDRREVIFSARRDSNFDIGLVSLDGSQVNWVPEDPADELSPRWAPRGHKAAFIVRNRGGDLVRTVHIPTAVQLVVDFPFGVVRDLAWDAAGERFAVAWESPDASPRVEVLRYGGEERRVAVPPAVQPDVSVTPFAGGLMLRPQSSVYNERLPLVVWMTSGRINEWNDARGALLRQGRVAVLILDRPIGDEVRDAIEQTSWIDRSRLFLVDPSGTAELAGAKVVRGDATVASGMYRRGANGIAVHPASVESVAAASISEQLKVPHGG